MPCWRFLHELGRTEGTLSSGVLWMPGSPIWSRNKKIHVLCQVFFKEEWSISRTIVTWSGLVKYGVQSQPHLSPAWSVESKQSHLFSDSCTTSVWRVTCSFSVTGFNTQRCQNMFLHILFLQCILSYAGSGAGIDVSRQKWGKSLCTLPVQEAVGLETEETSGWSESISTNWLSSSIASCQI